MLFLPHQILRCFGYVNPKGFVGDYRVGLIPRSGFIRVSHVLNACFSSLWLNWDCSVRNDQALSGVCHSIWWFADSLLCWQSDSADECFILCLCDILCFISIYKFIEITIFHTTMLILFGYKLFGSLLDPNHSVESWGFSSVL